MSESDNETEKKNNDKYLSDGLSKKDPLKGGLNVCKKRKDDINNNQNINNKQKRK